MPKKIRLDKWLWAVRIYKSRTMATHACKNGRITLLKNVLKPSYLIESGMELVVRKNGFHFTYKVIELIEKRVSASLAANCYENLTSAEELNKYNLWFSANQIPEKRARGAGRPTKKERREIDSAKSDVSNAWMEEEE